MIHHEIINHFHGNDHHAYRLWVLTTMLTTPQRVSIFGGITALLGKAANRDRFGDDLWWNIRSFPWKCSQLLTTFGARNVCPQPLNGWTYLLGMPACLSKAAHRGRFGDDSWWKIQWFSMEMVATFNDFGCSRTCPQSLKRWANAGELLHFWARLPNRGRFGDGISWNCQPFLWKSSQLLTTFIMHA